MSVKRSAREALLQIVREYGRPVTEDPRRVEGLLRDLAPDARRDTFLLIQALRSGVVKDLCAPNQVLAPAVVVDRCVRRLQEEYALTPQASAWAVGCWAEALGVPGPGARVPDTSVEPAAGRTPDGPTRLDALREEAHAHQVTGRHRRALRALNEVIDRRPDDRDARAARADVHRLLGRDDQAYADAEAVLDADPNSALALRVRGEIHRRRRDFEQALRDLNLSLALVPHSAPALLSRGDVFRELARPDRALADLDRSIELDPRPETYAARAVLHVQQQRPEQAREDLRRALALDPDQTAIDGWLQRLQHGSKGAASLLGRSRDIAPAAGGWVQQKIGEIRQSRSRGRDDAGQ